MTVVVVTASALELGDGVAVVAEAEVSIIDAVAPGVVKAATAMPGVTGFEYGVTGSLAITVTEAQRMSEAMSERCMVATLSGKKEGVMQKAGAEVLAATEVVKMMYKYVKKLLIDD